MIAMAGRAITGRHVLFGLLAFFGIVLAANAIFIYLAVDSFTGLSTENAYQRGVAYNRTLEARAAQRELGWGAELAFVQESGGRGTLSVEMRDRAGRPLDDLRISGQILRPTHAGHDQEVVLARSGPGTYAAALDLPLRGQWNVRLVAEARGGKRFEMERRIWLK